MDDYEAEHGAFTREEREQGRRTLGELGLLDVRAASCAPSPNPRRPRTPFPLSRDQLAEFAANATSF